MVVAIALLANYPSIHLAEGGRLRLKCSLFLLIRSASVFDILKAAGWPIWPLLFASVIAVALIIERATALRRSKIVPQGLLQSVVADYKQGGVKQDTLR